MKLSGTLFITLGCLLIVGGAIGFIKAGSYVSLICGLLLGIPLIILGFKTLKNSIMSENIALVITLITDIFFSYRLWTTKSLVPAGIMTIISTMVILLTCISIKRRASNSSN